ncbi:Protein of unknown function, partial [Gryllus bimaculatus]
RPMGRRRGGGCLMERECI